MLQVLSLLLALSITLVGVAPANACGDHATSRAMAYEANLAQWEQTEMTETLLNQADGVVPTAEAPAEAQLVAVSPVGWFNKVTHSLFGKPGVPSPYKGGKLRHKKGARSVPATNPQMKRVGKQRSGEGF